MVGKIGDSSAAVDIERVGTRIASGCCDGQTGPERRFEDGFLAWEADEAARGIEHYPVDGHFQGFEAL